MFQSKVKNFNYFLHEVKAAEAITLSPTRGKFEQYSFQEKMKHNVYLH